MSNSITKWWGRRSRWEKLALGTGAGLVAVATGGAAAYAIAAYGASVTVATAGGTTVTATIGKAALELAKRGRA